MHAPLYPLQDFKALYKYCIIIMVALCNTADHYIFILWFLLLIFLLLLLLLLLFPRLISAVGD